MPKQNAPFSEKKGVALYMRLSKEDETLSESASIENQRKILRAFARDNFLTVFDEYIDDGYSGTNMDRPAFMRMKSDIEGGKIGVVITKDFSRLGRNSGQVMTMLDDYFTKNRVRYISVSEGIDTHLSESSGLLAPMLSFVSEMYAGDISRKVNASFQAKMASGEFIGAFAPFGYKKDTANKNHLVPDPNAADTVKRIFALAAFGNSPRQIAEVLNSEGVLTPSMYRYEVNPALSPVAFHRSRLWTTSIIGKLLGNEVYLGHTIQGKTHKPSFKSRYIMSVPKENRISVKNTHEPLIDESTWEIVRKKMQSRAKIRESGFVNIFSGLAKCADCGKNMSTVLSHKGGYASLNCGGYKSGGLCACQSHAISYESLKGAVSLALTEQLRLTSADKEALISEITAPERVCRDDEKKLAAISGKLLRLFDSRLSGDIDSDTFDALRKRYEAEKAQLCAAQKRNASIPDEAEKSASAIFSRLESCEELDSDLLFTLIERIDVHRGEHINGVKQQRIDVYFKFTCEEKTVVFK